MQVLLELAAVIAPVVVCAGLGFIWARRGEAFPADFVTRLVTLIGTPALVAGSFTRLSVDLADFGQMAAAAAVALVCFGLLGAAILKLLKLPLHSYLPALMFPNAGNMGLPLCLFAFGEQGLTLAIVFFAVFSIAQFTIGVSIAAGDVSLRRLLRMPLPYAVLLSLPFLATHTPVPPWVANSLQLIGGLTIPLMLLALGVSLARLQVSSLTRSTLLAGLRLGGGVLLGLGLGWALGLDSAMRGVFIIQCAMPVAVFNYLFAQLYRRKPEEVAGAIIVSTAVSFLTLPLLLLLVL